MTASLCRFLSEGPTYIGFLLILQVIDPMFEVVSDEGTKHVDVRSRKQRGEKRRDKSPVATEHLPRPRERPMAQREPRDRPNSPSAWVLPAPLKSRPDDGPTRSQPDVRERSSAERARDRDRDRRGRSDERHSRDRSSHHSGSQVLPA